MDKNEFVWVGEGTIVCISTQLDDYSQLCDLLETASDTGNWAKQWHPCNPTTSDDWLVGCMLHRQLCVLVPQMFEHRVHFILFSSLLITGSVGFHEDTFA